MAERSSLNQNIQIGVEATPGTAVYASKRLQSIGIEPNIETEIDQFRPIGQKYRALATLGKEWTSARLSGRGSYTEIVYALSSVIDTPVISTPGGATDARNWQFVSDSFEDDTPKTFTIEHGSGVRADEFTYGLITELGMTFNRSSIEVTGSLIGKAITDGITMSAARTVSDGVTTDTDATLTSATASFTAADVGKIITGTGIPDGTTIASVTNGTTVELSAAATASGTGVTLTIGVITSVELVPIVPTQVSVYMDDTAASLGTTKLTRAISAEFSIGNRFAPVWVLDAGAPSFVAVVEVEPDVTFNLKLQADSTGMSLLDDMRSGTTKFIRVAATGGADSIESGQDYTFTADFALKLTDPGGFSDEEGVQAFEWNFVGVHDSTWGQAFEFNVVNALTAL